MNSFSTLIKAGQSISVIPSLRALYPALRFLVRISIVASLFYHLICIGLQPAPNDSVRSKAAAVMNRIGTGLLKQCKSDNSSDHKNVLSVLVQANTMEDKVHQLKDEDVLSRAYELILDWCVYSYTLSEIPTFLIAGHVTTRYARPSP